MVEGDAVGVRELCLRPQGAPAACGQILRDRIGEAVQADPARRELQMARSVGAVEQAVCAERDHLGCRLAQLRRFGLQLGEQRQRIAAEDAERVLGQGVDRRRRRRLSRELLGDEAVGLVYVLERRDRSVAQSAVDREVLRLRGHDRAEKELPGQTGRWAHQPVGPIDDFEQAGEGAEHEAEVSARVGAIRESRGKQCPLIAQLHLHRIHQA